MTNLIGCYECSQRRIHCDNSQPICHKCTLRGIECSGYGVRYRFKTASRDSKKIGLTRESNYDKEATANHSPLGLRRNLDPATCHTEDRNVILGDEYCWSSTNSRASDLSTRVTCRKKGFEPDPIELTGRPLEELTIREAAAPRNLMFESQKPWMQYLLNYCKSDAKSLRYNPDRISLPKDRWRNGGH